MTVSPARLRRLEAQRNARSGVVTVRDVGAGELAEFVTTSFGSNGQHWAQRRDESIDDLVARIEAETGVRRLILCTHPDRPVRHDLEVQRTYGHGTRIYMPDNGRDR